MKRCLGIVRWVRSRIDEKGFRVFGIVRKRKEKKVEELSGGGVEDSERKKKGGLLGSEVVVCESNERERDCSKSY